MVSELSFNEKRIMLKDIYEWAATVDANHPVLGDMYMHLNMEDAG
jgi:hypothetical protein